MKKFLVFCAIASAFSVCAQDAKPIRAIAVLNGANISGNVTFTQNGCGQPVYVEVSLRGLTEGEHGFHVHEKGDLSDGCTSLGAHYNPDKLNHGAPVDEVRHVGDLGNIKADATGSAKTIFSDSLISLTGSRSIVGRGLIVHQDVDDLGKGGNADSLKTGNAGGRAACAVIGYLNEDVVPECSSVERSAAEMPSISVPFLIIAMLLLNLRY